MAKAKSKISDDEFNARYLSLAVSANFIRTRYGDMSRYLWDESGRRMKPREDLKIYNSGHFAGHVRQSKKPVVVGGTLPRQRTGPHLFTSLKKVSSLLDIRKQPVQETEIEITHF